MTRTLVDQPEEELEPRKPGGRVLTVLLVLLSLGFLAWAALPLGGLEFDRYTVALVALTPYAALVGAVLALLGLLLRRWLTALVVGLVTALLAFTVVPRAMSSTAPVQGVPLRVLSVNAYFGQADAEKVVELVRRNQVDVLSLQELTPELVDRLDAAGLAAELPHRVFEAGPKADGSGIAARYPLRELDLVPGSTLAQPSALLERPGSPPVEIVAVHTLYPMGRDTYDVWRREMVELGQLPLDGTPRVLAGDFNATLDHSRLGDLIGRGYTDAAAATGAGLRATWPEGWFPPPVAIDHVLTTPEITPQSFEVFPMPGADHRAVLATLAVGRGGS
ncbi:endonuclease/exonuclease/phosphatase family protein [Saccharopolyspora hirsuta]|uniref:Endonuclease/exonuclease/phosphatase family protein n=1 Tax=Saccharopolyspora hirsuta TaxID=1837 RepID=A0A5M7BN81_SACHI|nr:endonuclease/exonuclease/phosphatase family protein [Saccharopolyspora hirsuta]KAA5829598.1 endonuclease/exonuclease/phosphatase family protein [Saccharopolyspora hirsuta]